MSIHPKRVRAIRSSGNWNFTTTERASRGFQGRSDREKSQALCYEALKLSYVNRGCTGLIGAPTYPMLFDSTLTSFLRMLNENEVPYQYLKSERTFLLHET